MRRSSYGKASEPANDGALEHAVRLLGTDVGVIRDAVPHRARAASMLVVVAGIVHAAPRVVATSGVKIDGLGVATLEAPGAASDGSIFFRGASTTLTIAGVTFATGGPLPAPFTGAIDEVMGGQMAGDLGAVLTSASGPDIAAAIFAVEAGTITALLTVAPTDPVQPVRFAMNARGDVVYLSRSPPGGAEIHALVRSSGVPQKIAGPDKNLRTLRALVMDESGAAAWMGRQAGVWHWDAEHGTRQVSGGRFPLRRGGRSPIALDAAFGLVYTTRDELGRFLPADGTVTTIARRGGAVAGITIRGLYGDTSFRDDGTATGLVRSKKRPLLRYVCLPPGGTPTECDGGGTRVSAGTAVAPTRSSAIFRASGAGIGAVVRPGDALDAAGTLADVTEQVVAGRSVVFLGLLDDGRDVLGWWRDGRVRAAVADGRTVGARTLDVSSPLHGATESTALVEGGVVDADGAGVPNASTLLLVRRDGRATSIRLPRKRRFRGVVVDEAALAGGRVVVLSDEALLAARGGRLVPLLVAGGQGPHPFASLVDVAAAGSRVVLVANRDAADALFELDPGGPRRLAVLPTSYSLLGLDATDVALMVSASHDGGTTFVDEVVLVDRTGVARTVATIGEPSPVGAIASIDAIALAPADVVLSARVSGDGARHALLAVDRSR